MTKMPSGVYKRSDEIRKRMSESHSGEKNPMYGKHFSEEHRRKLSQNHADFMGERSPNWGKKFSEETRKKMSENKRGEKCSNWRGGRLITNEGYILILRPDHPFCDSNHHVLEHRLVMEEMIGRYLTKDEIVHHKNGVKDDNRPENLQLMTKAEHNTFHKSHRL